MRSAESAQAPARPTSAGEISDRIVLSDMNLFQLSQSSQRGHSDSVKQTNGKAATVARGGGAIISAASSAPFDSVKLARQSQQLLGREVKLALKADAVHLSAGLVAVVL